VARSSQAEFRARIPKITLEGVDNPHNPYRPSLFDRIIVATVTIGWWFVDMSGVFDILPSAGRPLAVRWPSAGRPLAVRWPSAGRPLAVRWPTVRL